MAWVSSKYSNSIVFAIVLLLASGLLQARVNYPAHRAGHLKTILAVLETSLVRDDI